MKIKTDNIPLTKAYGPRGADMGRLAVRPVDALHEVKLRLHRLALDSGGYDSGGAYWGYPDDVWRAVGEDSQGNRVVTYTRAVSRPAAARNVIDHLRAPIKFWGLAPGDIPAVSS